MTALINNTDLRKYRQFGKQINTDSFAGYVNEIQENQLTELLGQSMAYDFFNFLENGFINYAGAFSRDSVSQITITGFDASLWADYSLRIDSDTFVLVTNAIYGGADTILTVTGYDLPATIATLDYSTENKYTKLLNGTTYTPYSDTIKYNGLRPFLAWYMFTLYLLDGDQKQGDIGNFKITGELFQHTSSAEKAKTRSSYLQNATREQNRITDYLNSESSTYTLWSISETENITNNDIIII